MKTYRITVKNTKTDLKIQKGMMVEIKSSYDWSYNGTKKIAIKAFQDEHDIDVSKIMTNTYFDIEEIE